jgi:hypothetical protein
MKDRETAGRRRGCFKYGCFGCLGATGLFIVVIGAIAVLTLVLGPPDQEFVRPDIERTIPVSPAPSLESIIADDPGRRFPAELAPPPPLRPAQGRLVLDLLGANFEILPGEAGDPFRIEGEYNAGGFELLEEFQPQDEGPWTYRIKFGRSVSRLRMLFGDQHEKNRIRIIVPRGLPIILEGRLSTGFSRIELGGLWLTEVDLKAGLGEHEIRFSKPTPRPLQRFELEAKMGEFEVGELGNASPAAVTVNGTMGELRLDLHGAWKHDAEIRTRWRMGECVVRVPEGVAVETGGTGVSLGATDYAALRGLPPPPEGAPKLKLNLGGSMGEVRISR